MKSTILFINFIFSLLLLTSCSTTTLPIIYTPSNLVTGTGLLFVESFYYSAAHKGTVAPNEPESNPSGIGTIYLSDSIETIFTNAVRKELRFSGYKLAKGTPISISGTIERFYYDWVGFSSQSIDITVIFRVRKNGKEIFLKTITSNKKAPKSSGYEIEAMKSAISDCIHHFLQEAHEKGIL